MTLTRASASLRTRAKERAQRLLLTRGLELDRYPLARRIGRLEEQGRLEAVLDIGANTGQYARGLRATGYAGRIVSVEPLTGPFGELTAAAHRDPSWSVERAAVGPEPGEVVMNVAANTVSSSVLPMSTLHTDAAAGSSYVGVETVPCTTIDDLVQRHGLAPARTLLKIDVQGYEMSALRGAALTLPEVAAVQVEVSLAELYDGQAERDELLEPLAALGFGIWAVSPGFSDPRTLRMLQYDVLLVREP